MRKDITIDVPGQTEDALQQKCYFWYWNTYPHRRGLLFSVPNGGYRRGKDGKTLKQTGLYAGVSDLILLVNGKAFFIELKKDEFEDQGPKQVVWGNKVTQEGFLYTVIRSLEDFKKTVANLIKDNE